jgi:branched-chain amino acid transport system ATP-binding protein
MLRLDNVTSSYGRIRAIEAISLEVQAGEIVSLIGANGAGKSTTLMTVCGIVKATHGSIRFDGRELAGRRPHEIVRSGLIQVPEGRRILPSLTVDENLDLGGYELAAQDRRLRRESMYDMFPRLGERRKQQGGTLSGGEQQMLALGRALMCRPKLLMLDEPSLGLAPKVIDQIFDIIVDLNRSGTTILLVEQNAMAALEIAHRAYVLETGRVVLSGAASALARDPTVRRAYLGL